MLPVGFREPRIHIRRSRIKVMISPAAEVYQVGQPIPVRVTAVCRRDSQIYMARAGLVAKIWYGQRAGTPTPWGIVPDPNPRPSSTRTLTNASSRLDLAGPLPAGTRVEREAVVRNWATAPSGGKAPGRRVEYWVRADVALGDGVTVRGEAPVWLVSGRYLNQGVEGTRLRHRVRNCELELQLPVLHGRPGDTLRGVLRVQPRRPVRIRRVLVFLLRVEASTGRGAVRYAVYRRNNQSTLRDWMDARSVTVAKRVRLSAPGEFPFAVRIPGEVCPTLITPYLSVHWYVRARVSYGLRRRPDMLDRELNIYLGDGAPGAISGRIPGRRNS
jgi:hypothetical protein